MQPCTERRSPAHPPHQGTPPITANPTDRGGPQRAAKRAQIRDLPLELWVRILTLACKNSNRVREMAILGAFRPRSRTLREACSACRTSVHICSSLAAHRPPRLGTLAGVVSATILVDEHRLLPSDLLLLSRCMPSLTSLALVRRSAGGCALRNLASLLQPWRASLVQLEVHDCQLSQRGPAKLRPDLPALRALTMRQCTLTCLDLTLCAGLQALCLEENPLLVHLDLNQAGALRRVVCIGNPRLNPLHLGSCSALTALECHGNTGLECLVLPEKPVAQGIQFSF